MIVHVDIAGVVPGNYQLTCIGRKVQRPHYAGPRSTAFRHTIVNRIAAKVTAIRSRVSVNCRMIRSGVALPDMTSSPLPTVYAPASPPGNHPAKPAVRPRKGLDATAACVRRKACTTTAKACQTGISERALLGLAFLGQPRQPQESPPATPIMPKNQGREWPGPHEKSRRRCTRLLPRSSRWRDTERSAV